MALLDKLEMVGESAPEIGNEFDLDPAPDQKPAPRKRATRTQPAPRKPAVKSVDRMAKEVGRDLGTMIEMTAAVWGMRDQCCAPVLEKQARPIGDAIAAILARNPELLAKFANADSGLFLMQCLALGNALLPVGKAVLNNHVLRSQDVEAPANVDVTNLAEFPVFSGVPRGDTA